MTKRRVLLLVTAMVVPTVLLVLIEVGLRLGGYGTRSDFFVPIEGQRAWTTNPNFARQFFPPALARLPQPIRVAFDKPDDVMRIVVLGGSAAMGEPEPAYSFGRILEVMLERTYPDRQFEVINTAMATINSHVVRLIASELHKVQPDAVLIYMGNNEVVGPFGAGTVFGAYVPSLRLIRTGIWLRQFRIGQLTEDVVRWVAGRAQYVTEGQGMAMFRGQHVQADDERLQRVYAHFEQNLTDIIEASESTGARVVVSTVGANVLDHAPFASVFGREGLGNPLSWGKLFADAIGHEAAGERDAAIAAFEMANRIDSSHAELNFRLGHLYLERDDTSAARRCLIRARDLDALRFRVDSHMNGLIGAARGNVYLIHIDGDSLLSRRDPSGVGVAGDHLFHEHVHLTFEGNYLLASAFANALHMPIKGITHYWAPPPTPPWLPTIYHCADDLALTPFDRYRLHASVSGLMGRAPFTNQFDYLEKRKRINAQNDSLRAAGTSSAGIGRSLRAYQVAIERRPDDLILQQNYARILQETGALVDATSRWKRLLDMIPNAPSWRLAYATALSDQGAHQAALHAYRELEQAMPGLVLPHIQIGFEYVSTGQIGEAIHTLEEALRINPGSTIARLNLSSLYEDVGDSTRASAVLSRGLEVVRARDDQHEEAGLLVGRAELMMRRGHQKKAILDLESARTLYEVSKDVGSEAAVRLRLAKAMLAASDTTLAEATLNEGLAFARSYVLTETAGQFLIEKAVMQMGRGREAAAKGLLREAIEVFRGLSDRHPALARLEVLVGG